jgi:hypothetical protein
MFGMNIVDVLKQYWVPLIRVLIIIVDVLKQYWVGCSDGLAMRWWWLR